MTTDYPIDENLDLVLQREVDVPPEKVWQAWTNPEHLKQWFAPRPWAIADVAIDLRPGGKFYTKMRSPEGEEFPGTGCILEVETNRKLVWTDALGPNYRPNPEPFFTAVVTMEPTATGTRYTAIAIHKDLEGKKQHEEMGFLEGWGTVADQMVEYIKANL